MPLWHILPAKYELYPQNHALAVSLASQIMNNASAHNTSIDESERKAMLDEGIALCQRVLRDCPGGNDENDMLRLGAKILLVHMLCRAERREEAVGIAQMMPGIPMSQEIILQGVLTGEERIKYSLAVMPLLIVMITSSFLKNLTYPDKDKSISLWEYTAEDCLCDISVWDIFYAPIDKTDGGAAKRSNWAYMFLHQRAAKAMLEAGDKSSSVEYFRRAVECLPYVDSDSANFKYNNTNFTFNLLQRKTIVSSDPLCLQDGNNYTGRSNAYVMLHGYIENGYYKGLEEEPGYAEVLEKLRKMC